MSKERPRYKVIEEYEKEFKQDYSLHIGRAFSEVVKVIKEIANAPKHIPDTNADRDSQ